MTDLIAQATQSSGGYSTWSPLEWGAFFAAAGVFVGGLVTGIIGIIKAARAQATADANAGRMDRLSERTGRTEDKVFEVAKAMPPTPPSDKPA